MIHAKYLKNTSLFGAQPKQPDSSCWKAILKAWGVLKNGFHVKLGCGKVSFWYDQWLDFGPICHQAPFVYIQKWMCVLEM